MSTMKKIDFTRPTKFTPDHERRLGRALAAFCRTSSTRLSAELRLPIELEFVEATQLTWANAHERLASSALCAVVELQPTETQVLLAADSGFILTGIESLLSGAPEEPPPDRRLSEIDLALAGRLFDDMLGQLTAVWRDLTGAELALVGIDSQLETAGVAPVSEPTLELAMRARMLGREFALTLLLPHRAIAPVEARILGRRGDGDEVPDPVTGLRLREAMAGIEVALRAEIAGPQTPAAEVLGLAPGATLRLGGRVGEGLGLCVEGVRVMRAKPGRSGSRRAVQVLEAIEPGAAEGLARLATTAQRAGAVEVQSGGEPDAALRGALGQVPVRVWAELGRARLSLAEVVALGVGAVVELDRRLEDPIDLYVNGLRLGHGELEIVDEEWAVRVDAVTGLGEPAVALGDVTMATVSVIVHLEGGRERTLRCLETLAALEDEPTFEAILVDDASPDLGELLAGLSGDVKVLRNERREGFIPSAIRAADSATSKTLVLLRGPALLAPDALAHLLGACDETCAAHTGPPWAPMCASSSGAQSDPTRRASAAAAALPDDRGAHPTATHALAFRRADADCLRDAAGAAPEFEIAAICAELARHGPVVTVPAAIATPASAAVAARQAPGERAELTVVVPTLDATAPRVRACLAAIAANTPAPHQVVVIDNGSPPRGFTAPVNAGLRAVDTAYAVVMNDDVEVLEGWWEPLRTALDDGASVVFPQTVEGAMRDDFAAWCFALDARALTEMSHAPGEFFDPALRVWFQDTDLLIRLRAIGRPPELVPESQIRHALSATVRTEDPALRAWIDLTIAADKAAFGRKHPTALST